MKWLVLIHVLSSIIGIGPTFFGHILLRKRQQVGELRQALKMFEILNAFPKTGGPIAVLSGIALVWMGGWEFVTFWIVGSLVLYVLIQIVAIGMVGPVIAKLGRQIGRPELEPSQELPAESVALLTRADRLFYVASSMGVVIFIFMILKP